MCARLNVQSVRELTLANFAATKNGGVLLCTDLAARGLVRVPPPLPPSSPYPNGIALIPAICNCSLIAHTEFRFWNVVRRSLCVRLSFWKNNQKVRSPRPQNFGVRPTVASRDACHALLSEPCHHVHIHHVTTAYSYRFFMISHSPACKLLLLVLCLEQP